MTRAILIQARTASTRLPGKIYAGIPNNDSKPLLLHVVDRMRIADCGDVVVLIPSDDSELASFLKVHNVRFIAGPHEDVRERYRQAVRELKVDLVVRATADNPCLDPRYARLTAERLEQDRLDLFSFSGMPLGTGVEAFTSEALFQDGLDGPQYREHVSLHIKHEPDRFRVLHTPWSNRPMQKTPRLTVDCAEDLVVVRALFRELGDAFVLDDVLTLFAHRPELFSGNENVKQITFQRPGEQG
ncbi:MAG: NTP transferase domain-containing protein [Spirochaetia bacterium]|nr:NTP transferase domain-containing protein [Spirochaetia bacterium]